MKNWIFSFLMVLCFPKIDAQTNINFRPLYLNHVIKPDSLYSDSNGDSIYISNFRFYISDVELFHNNERKWQEDQSYHLLDIKDSNSLNFILNTDVVFNNIRFNLGIDSVTNSQGALGGSLDPTRGMYWTWQNGYINVKLEGKSSVSKNNKNEFLFHIGGYQSPFNSLQTLTFDVKNKKHLVFAIHLDWFFRQIDLSKQANIMSPGNEAVDLAIKIKNIFSILD